MTDSQSTFPMSSYWSFILRLNF